MGGLLLFSFSLVVWDVGSDGRERVCLSPCGALGEEWMRLAY